MAFAMLEMEDEDLNEFADAIKELKTKIHFCPICGNITEDDKCYICKDDSRDQETVLVVSSPKDIIAFENAEGYHGLYHVLGGTISISKGKGIEDLNIDSLIKRVEEGKTKEASATAKHSRALRPTPQVPSSAVNSSVFSMNIKTPNLLSKHFLMH